MTDGGENRDHIINYNKENFAKKVLENTKNQTNAKYIANMNTTDIMGLLDTRKKRETSKLSSEHLSDLIEYIKSNKITRASAKLALDEIIKNGRLN